MTRVLSIFAAVLIISGCTAFDPQARPDAPLDLPEQFSMFTAGEAPPDRWWQSFKSDELDRLVAEALSGNFDIRTVWTRLRQADAVARKAGADLKPAVAASAGAKKSWQQTRTDERGTLSSDSDTWSAGVSAAYEVDLWGRLKSLRASEALKFLAAREDLEAAAMTVAAQVAAAWTDILACRQQITLLKEQIRTNEDLLKIQRVRFANGQARALAVSQQRQALAQARAKLPPLQLSEQQQQNALAVLLGRSGARGMTLEQKALPGLIPVPATGLPADLLAARPDIRAAGLRLNSADWQVSAARADRMPAITLSAEAAFSSGFLDLLLGNWVSTLAAGITGPLFDGGSRLAEVDRLRAEAEEALNDYAATVAQAIQEVEDSLVTEKRQGEYIALLQEQLHAARTTMKNARLQYINGQDNYLDYLSAWTSVQDLERQMVDEQATRIKNRITLYRTMGGDWTREIAAEKSPATKTGPGEKDTAVVDTPLFRRVG